MAPSGADQVSLTHEKELAVLRRKRRRRLALWILLTGFLILFLLVVPGALLDYEGNQGALEKAREELLFLGSDWGRVISSQQYYYRQWLLSHGTKGEVACFNVISLWVLRSATGTLSGRFYLDRWQLLSNVYLSLHTGVLRVVFILLVSWRVWLVVIVIAAIYGFYSYEVYNRSDLLGQLGNKRFFFSGIQAGLDNINQDGAPELQVTGLACPKSVPLLTASTHSLGKLLHQYQAANQTTMSLAAILIRYREWPPYLAEAGAEDLLEQSFVATDLSEHSALLLEKALLLQASYQEQFNLQPLRHRSSKVVLEGAALSKEQRQSEAVLLESELRDLGKNMLPLVVKDDDQRYNSASYAAALQQAFDQVLTPELKREIAALSSAELATVVLAYQAGKSLAYGRVSSKWVKKSNFPHLSARAVLHSLPSYSNDFDFNTRTILRRALIYGSRKSAFATVRFPLDFSKDSQALRQWVELLMACPHELRSVADDLELFAQICAIHQEWTARFLDGVAALRQDLLQDVYVSPHNLLFISVKQVLALARQFVSPGQWSRLEALGRLADKRNRITEMAQQAELGEVADSDANVQSSLLAPFSKQELTRLAKLHQLSESDVRDWGILRLALNSFAWLGRRVGDYTVPASSLIFTVFSPERPLSDQNSLGLLGRKGMVALRTRRLEERFGRSWRNAFIPVNWAKMAESLEDFQKLLSGIEEIIEIDKDGMTGLD